MGKPLTKTCEYCGKSFDADRLTQRFCNDSDSCQRAWWKEHRKEAGKKYTFICKNCGEEYSTVHKECNQYCSKECAYEYKKADRRCDACNKPVGRGQKYCSVECMCSYECICSLCGETYKGKANQRLGHYCSDACRKEIACIKDVQRNINEYELIERACKECGRLFVPEYTDKRRGFCSGQCARAYGRRVGRGVRRARMHSVRYEYIDPLRVLDRDGWKCYVCGCATPKELRGTIRGDAPEVDHVVPLAKGGSHTMDNLACICRYHNQTKGDKPLQSLQFSRARPGGQVHANLSPRS